jgi:protein-S-isoprenylcysteine O-methyltransferase Ste14
MDRARYIFAVLLVIGLPPALVWWFVIHPFVGFWRRVGVRITFTLIAVGFVASLIGLYRLRGPLVGADLGTQWPLVALATLCVASAGWIGWKRRKYLTFRILAGVPELEADGAGGTLLTEGPYAVVRNPRYVEVLFGTLGYAAFSNYAGAWLMALVTFPLIHLIVLLEERELKARFGEGYEEYLRSVPRYLPRFGGRSPG